MCGFLAPISPSSRKRIRDELNMINSLHVPVCLFVLGAVLLVNHHAHTLVYHRPVYHCSLSLLVPCLFIILPPHLSVYHRPVYHCLSLSTSVLFVHYRTPTPVCSSSSVIRVAGVVAPRRVPMGVIPSESGSVGALVGAGRDRADAARPDTPTPVLILPRRLVLKWAGV